MRTEEIQSRLLDSAQALREKGDPVQIARFLEATASRIASEDAAAEKSLFIADQMLGDLYRENRKLRNQGQSTLTGCCDPPADATVELREAFRIAHEHGCHWPGNHRGSTAPAV